MLLLLYDYALFLSERKLPTLDISIFLCVYNRIELTNNSILEIE